jgi:hypothetical protein
MPNVSNAEFGEFQTAQGRERASERCWPFREADDFLRPWNLPRL